MRELTDEEINGMSSEELEVVFLIQMIADRVERVKEKELPESDYEDVNDIFMGKREITKEEVEALMDEMEYEISREIMENLPDYVVKEVNEKIDAGTLDEEEYDKIIEEAGIDRMTVTENAMLDFREGFFRGEYDDLLSKEAAGDDSVEDEMIGAARGGDGFEDSGGDGARSEGDEAGDDGATLEEQAGKEEA